MAAIKAPVLSISMLVSNGRTDTIKKCMESMLPLRKAVPSELIVVDTGCTDGSIEIAKEYADRVISFTWCNDFSAARNAGLRECSGEWFLYLDDDEWFEDTGEIEHFFTSGEYREYDGAWYIQRNYEDFEGKKFSDSCVGRLNPLTRETRFVSKIHEYLFPAPVKVKRFQAFVHHYGYVYKNEEERQKHLLRNLTLEEEVVAANPKDIRMCCQLVQEYRAARRLSDAEKLCRETLEKKLFPDANPFMQYLLTCLPRISAEQGQWQEALEGYQELERSGKVTFMAKILCSYEKLYIYDKLGRNVELLLQAEEFLRLRDANPEKEDYPVMDFATYTSDMIYQRVVENGIKAMLRLDTFQRAEFFFERVDWKRKDVPAEAFIKTLLMAYQETGNQRFLAEEAEKISAVSSLREMWLMELESFLRVYAGVSSEEKEELTQALMQTNARKYMDAAKSFPIAIPVLREWMKAAELALLSRQMRDILTARLQEGNTVEVEKLLCEVEGLLPGEDWICKIRAGLKK